MFEKYASLQKTARPGAGDDAQELLARAKNKKAVLDAMKAQPAPAAGAAAAKEATPGQATAEEEEIEWE
jgi:hypothetical protein